MLRTDGRPLVCLTPSVGGSKTLVLRHEPVGGAVGADGGRSAQWLAEVSEDGGSGDCLDPLHLAWGRDVEPLHRIIGNVSIISTIII